MANVNALKDAGNKAFAAKDWDKAIDLFSQAITLDPGNHVLYSNRSAANSGKKAWAAALEDAEQCIRCNPTWSKGYARKGAALHGARRWDEAIAAYEEGLKLEDSPALRKGLHEVKEARDADSSNSGGGFSQVFSDPNLLGKLAANPKTAPFLADPAFVQRLQMIQRNPQLADMGMQDPRMITVLGVLLGIDIQGFSRPEGSDELPEGLSVPSPQPPPTSAPPPTAQPVPTEADTRETINTDDPDLISKSEADVQKKIGSEAYRQRDFNTAEAAFSKAWELWPKDLTYLTNLSAVFFEKGEYDKCIETCEKAVESGRSMRADYKLIAKAFGRIGSAYAKKGDVTSAIKYFEKSLAEHRTPDILAKLKEAEKQKSEADRLAYISPQISAEERERGNVLFKSGNFADAVKAYTEAIKRDPSDARGYNNRAAAYSKLAALPEALKDSDKAIEIDPTFVKAHIRKATVLLAMREHSRAMEAAARASDVDGDHKHTGEIEALLMKINYEISSQRAGETDEETLQRAMRDPEIAAIMRDPIMQSILQQAQSDPAALQEHMKNPMIQQKILKLVQAGVIKTGR